MSDDAISVLFLQSDARVSDFYVPKLEMDGYRVAVAAGGEEALRIGRHRTPDLIVLDATQPSVEPFVTLERLRREGSTERTPVVVVTREATHHGPGLRLGML
jgi:DNA-binding response OmpR family regulator